MAFWSDMSPATLRRVIPCSSKMGLSAALLRRHPADELPDFSSIWNNNPDDISYPVSIPRSVLCCYVHPWVHCSCIVHHGYSWCCRSRICIQQAFQPSELAEGRRAAMDWQRSTRCSSPTNDWLGRTSQTASIDRRRHPISETTPQNHH